MITTLVIGNRNYSSWSLRAWWAARRSGLSFAEVRLALDTDEFTREIAAYSPSRRVPVLHHQGRVVWDTLAICEYLAEISPKAQMWPATVTERSRARSFCAEMHSGLAALREQLPMNCRARKRRVQFDEACAADIERIQEIWADCLSQKSVEGRWLFGHWTIADAFFAPVAMRFRTYDIDLSEPAASWANAVLSDPEIEDWVRLAAEETELVAADETG
ncbi:MAG: glutathione S-transferase family protein [Gammaproteobacteria bacterium]|nr:glutathione S-transferase family protein [Gammaproteobacteria bacterium]